MRGLEKRRSGIYSGRESRRRGGIYVFRIRPTIFITLPVRIPSVTETSVFKLRERAVRFIRGNKSGRSWVLFARGGDGRGDGGFVNNKFRHRELQVGLRNVQYRYGWISMKRAK